MIICRPLRATAKKAACSKGELLPRSEAPERPEFSDFNARPSACPFVYRYRGTVRTPTTVRYVGYRTGRSRALLSLRAVSCYRYRTVRTLPVPVLRIRDT